MNDMEIAISILEKRYIDFCECIIKYTNSDISVIEAGKSKTDTTTRAEKNYSDEQKVLMIVEDSKQRLMSAVRRGDTEYLKPFKNTAEINKRLVDFRIALENAFDRAKVIYSDEMKDNTILRDKFTELTYVTIPNCSSFNSEYMRKYYPTMEAFIDKCINKKDYSVLQDENKNEKKESLAQRIKRKKDDKKRNMRHAEAERDELLKSVQIIAWVECLITLKELLLNTVHDAQVCVKVRRNGNDIVEPTSKEEEKNNDTVQTSAE